MCHSSCSSDIITASFLLQRTTCEKNERTRCNTGISEDEPLAESSRTWCSNLADTFPCDRPEEEVRLGPHDQHNETAQSHLQSDPSSGSRSDDKHTSSSTSGTDSSESERLRYQEDFSSSDEEREEDRENQFALYIVCKKQLEDFKRELGFLKEYIELNTAAFRKIVKKFDKKTAEVIDVPVLSEFMKRFEDFRSRGYLSDTFVEGVQDRVNAMIDVTCRCKPHNNKWHRTKVYTIGCFDLFHRGHANLLRALREYGRFIVVGIHDDNSYFQLKNKYPIDNLEKRMENLRPYVDMTFVIPSTEPTPFLRVMVSPQDIEDKTAVYVRGSDMPNFPGREWIESCMPVHLIPRSEGVSSSLVRTLYHTDNQTKDGSGEEKNNSLRAAFAKLDDTGKPIIDEDTEPTDESLKHAVIDPAWSVAGLVLGKSVSALQ